MRLKGPHRSLVGAELSSSSRSLRLAVLISLLGSRLPAIAVQRLSAEKVGMRVTLATGIFKWPHRSVMGAELNNSSRSSGIDQPPGLQVTLP
jgi:hypothetical protein